MHSMRETSSHSRFDFPRSLRQLRLVPSDTRRAANTSIDPSPADVLAELDERLRAAYDQNGVDLSLIRSNLAKTPTERVRELEDLLNVLATARRITP